MVVGFAVYYYTYSTWQAKPGIFLEDLYVQEHERHKGYGTMLLTEVASRVAAINGGRLEWDVLKWNEPSINFYKSLGAQQLDEWNKMRLEGKDIHALITRNTLKK
jgi:GNAT superfamily N-acetyltransferase